MEENINNGTVAVTANQAAKAAPSGTKALVFSILATAFVFDKGMLLVGLVFSIIGIVLSNKGKGSGDKMFKVSKTLSVISLVAVIISIVVFMIAFIGSITAIITLISSGTLQSLFESVAGEVSAAISEIVNAISSIPVVS